MNDPFGRTVYCFLFKYAVVLNPWEENFINVVTQKQVQAILMNHNSIRVHTWGYILKSICKYLKLCMEPMNNLLKDPSV